MPPQPSAVSPPSEAKLGRGPAKTTARTPWTSIGPLRKGPTSLTNEPAPDATTDQSTQASDATSVERNKAVSRRWIEVFNARDDAAEADVRAPDYVAHAPVSLEPTPLDSEAWTRFLSGFVEGFPDLQLTVEDAVGEGDLVAQRIHFEGTHTGEFQGLPPTHRKVTFSGLELNRFVDGRVVEHWFQLDSLTLLQELGLVVVPGPRLLPRVLAHQLKKLRHKR
jgi:predicted ester cyclase